MKDFVKMVLAVVCGLFVMGIVSLFFFVAFAGAIAAGSSSQPYIPKSGVLKIDMSKIVIAEQSQESNPLSAISGQPVEVIGLRSAVRALDAAALDPAVKYVYLKTDGMSTSLAAVQEFRQALKEFREISGKAVISYIESPTTGSYFLSSVADKVYMTPHNGSMIAINGVSSQTFFLKDILDKLGVHVQLIRHGKYKSAGETFIRNSPSTENRMQYQAMVDALWNSLAEGIAESRGLGVEQVNDCVDNLALCLPQDFLDRGFADELLDREALEEKLAALAVCDKFNQVKMIPFSDYVKSVELSGKTGGSGKLAVIYADGEIVDGSDTRQVAGDRFAALVEAVRADSTVKAVVLRVNSPGGSVLAAEKIKAEVDRLAKVKPVVASFGDYAASGGYWISCGCSRIFADDVTLTGSIGVFSMIPDFSGTLSDIAHVNVTSFNSNRHSDVYSLTRPFDKDEYAYMQRSVEEIYNRFLTIVSEGRGLSVDKVDEIAQGRVWAGSDALEIGLVDEIGSLWDAVIYARTIVEDGDLLSVVEYPKIPSAFEVMMSSLKTGSENDFSIFAEMAAKIKEPKLVARLPYEIVLGY